MARTNPINPSAYPISTEFTTVDATPASSPASAGNGSVVTIKVPDYAAEVYVTTNQDMYISEHPLAGPKYLLKANVEHVRGVGNTENLYLKQVSGPGDIYFMFALIK